MTRKPASFTCAQHDIGVASAATRAALFAQRLFIHQSIAKNRGAGTTYFMHIILKALTVSLLMLEAAGCGCSDVGCSTSLRVALNKASTVWEPGSYVVSVDTDGTMNSCTFDIPLAAAPDCTNRFQVELNLLLSGPSDVTKGPESISIFSTPTGVQVTVTRDGATIGTSYFLPTYTVQEPNGEFCGPTCYVSSSELSVL